MLLVLSRCQLKTATVSIAVSSVYCNNSQSGGAVNMQPPRQSAPVHQSGTAPPYVRQKRKGLAVIDPSTGQDISEDINWDSSSSSDAATMTSTTAASDSASSSSRATPQTVSDSNFERICVV